MKTLFKLEVQTMRDAMIFTKIFFKLVWITRGVLFFLLALLFSGGILFARFEGLSFSKGLYLSFITGLTIGYGDVVPTTALGQTLSILVGIIGVIFMGLIVGIATNATRMTILKIEEIKLPPRNESTQKGTHIWAP